MRDINAYVPADGPVEIPSGEEATQAFGHILSSRLTSLYRKAYRMLGNAADAEDAVQDALLAAYTHLDQFKEQSEMSTWVTAFCIIAPGCSCGDGDVTLTCLSTNQWENLRHFRYRSS